MQELATELSETKWNGYDHLFAYGLRSFVKDWIKWAYKAGYQAALQDVSSVSRDPEMKAYPAHFGVPSVTGGLEMEAQAH